MLSLGHTLLAIITKAAAIIQDDQFIDMMPVAWELLFETDQELAAAAGLSDNCYSFLKSRHLLTKHVLL